MADIEHLRRDPAAFVRWAGILAEPRQEEALRLIASLPSPRPFLRFGRYEVRPPWQRRSGYGRHIACFLGWRLVKLPRAGRVR